MLKDSRGLTMMAASADAVAAYDHVIAGYVSYAADMTPRMAALFAADPDCPMAHCLKGYFAMLGFKQALVPAARLAAADTWRLVVAATPREHGHAAALEAWSGGHPDRAVEIWDQILASHPHDILAFRLAHFTNFWLGRPEAMLASVLAVEKHWSEAEPGYNAILGCRCFAHEECGSYTEAEAAGREAIRRDPGDLWSAHGVAHVMEMQGRRGEGIAWVESLERHWDGKNNLKHHLLWHRAMYHLERGDFPAVLRLYDTGFRDHASPLTQAQPDLYIDVQNAASMLYRLGRLGVDLGDRWSDAGRNPRPRRHDAGPDRATGWNRGPAGDRGRFRPRPGPSRRRRRGDAAGAGGDVPPRRQPRAAGRAGAGVSRFGAEGRLGRRCADADGACGRPPPGPSGAPDRLRDGRRACLTAPSAFWGSIPA